ncbi:MAG TPA: formimidoylglutamate deiminase [Nakamurella sp.]|nr:formimidoylglutamate deiminase [Nakamurella sp.]
MTPNRRAAVFRCASAWIDGTVRRDVDIRCLDGVIASVSNVGGPVLPGDTVEALAGIVVPGFADAHSHVFHRALRGRTHQGGGTFWTWREAMYDLAGRLTPDTLRELAFATYLELLGAGYTAVGEFHYLHHQAGGRPYAEPNAMGLALADAAGRAGIGLTLLDVAYLSGGFDVALSPVQQRFSDGSAQAWADRVDALRAAGCGVRVGVAVHSVRAVPVRDLPVVAAAAQAGPVHAHLSEQQAENDNAFAATGRTPAELLDEAGVLGPATAVVHGTHLTAADIDILGRQGCFVVICPTTEADLADGLPPAAKLSAAGARLALGGDQHVVVDPFAQARGLELGERLAGGHRGVFSPGMLWHTATAESHAAIGSPAGELVPGAPADLVAISTDSVRTAGADPAQLVMCASAADVRTVVVGGVVRVRSGNHVTYGDPGPLLAAAIDLLWR